MKGLKVFFLSVLIFTGVCGLAFSHGGYEEVGLKGPKKTIAVTNFERETGIQGYTALGDDFTSQLTDALIQSEKFVVLSRTELASVITEQDLAASGRMAKSEAAQKGKIIPAQILINGKITDFEYDTKGGSQGLELWGIRIGGKKTSAHIALIVQIVDSTTGEVLDSKRVEANANATGFDIGYRGSWSISSSSFKKTPLGKATQVAIDRAVEYITKKLSNIPWEGRIVKAAPELVYVNAGRNSGMSIGTKLAVYRQGESLIDPATGIDLGSEDVKIADIEIIEVQDKFSKAKVSNATSQVQASDIVLKY